MHEDIFIINGHNMLNTKQDKDIFNSTSEIQKRMIEWIDFCLVARENNEDIYELSPYLKEYKNELS